METKAIYELMQTEFARVLNKLESIDSRLRNVEIDVARLKERKLIVDGWRGWLGVLIAIAAALIAWFK